MSKGSLEREVEILKEENKRYFKQLEWYKEVLECRCENCSHTCDKCGDYNHHKHIWCKKCYQEEKRVAIQLLKSQSNSEQVDII